MAVDTGGWSRSPRLARAPAFPGHSSAKGPVSRILSRAVIPLGAALPRTLISDLPGGSGFVLEPPGRTGPVRSALMAPGVALPSLFVLAPCGVYPAPGLTAGAVRSYRTISPLPRHRGNQPGKPGRRSGVALDRNPTYVIAMRGSRGGIFSVALAVCWPLSPHPGRYPAHCPAEFGLSSPGSLVAHAAGSDRPVLLPRSSLPRKLSSSAACRRYFCRRSLS
jgi:hypothetical protein